MLTERFFLICLGGIYALALSYTMYHDHADIHASIAVGHGVKAGYRFHHSGICTWLCKSNDRVNYEPKYVQVLIG